MSKRDCVLLLISIFLFSSYKTSAQVSAADLTCQYKKAPLAIETQKPSLSWSMRSPQKNIKQIAYSILVSDNLKALKKGSGNIWSTGRVVSDKSIQILYKGKKLLSAKKYFWCVRVWDNKGNVSEWSEPASWQMGLLTRQDWKGASWIAYANLPRNRRIVPAFHLGGPAKLGLLKDTLPLFRKEFSLKKPVKQALMFVAGLGHFDLSLNGKKVGDNFLDAGWVNYDKQALYVGFDLTTMLQKGKNAIGVMLGNGFYHVPAERYRKITGTFGYPKMICRMIIQYQDGTIENIVSDASWKTAPGPITFSSIFGGEDYDARLEQKDWDSAGFDAALWKSALPVQGSADLNAQDAAPLKVMQTFSPVKVSQLKPDVWLFDLGQNFSGIPRISVKGKNGAAVRIVPGEILDENGFVSQRPSGGPAYFNYTLKGAETESWQPQFTYYGFRYLQVEGGVPYGQENAKGLPVILDLKGLHTRNSAKAVGTFSCSSPLFNDIFKLIDWSVKSNMSSVLTDCPHREKLGWLEVPHLLGNSIRYNYDIATFYRKIITDMKLAQTNNGLVPNIAPEWVQFDPDFRDSPEWGSSSVILPWYLYKWYGDKLMLTENYTMMQGYVDYLTTKSKNHIVAHGLGDWFDIGPNGSGSGYSVSTPQGITGTAMYYYDLNILIRTATILGKTTDAIRYKNLAKKVKKAFNTVFFNPQTKQYGTGSQTANAMAIYVQLVEPENKSAVLENIITNIRSRNNRLSSGEVGYKYLLAVLEAEGRSDVIYDMNSRADVPGYGYQIAHGATTLMEDWQAIKTLGNNHCMLGHLMGWFYSGLGGIREADDGIAFNKIIICPEPVGDITMVKATYISPYGYIRSEWKKSSGVFELNVDIPTNTDAKIYLPSPTGVKIFENGVEINRKRLTNLDGKSIVEVGSGKYQFLVK
jgi:alpha-L-rhamnosidase